MFAVSGGAIAGLPAFLLVKLRHEIFLRIAFRHPVFCRTGFCCEKCRNRHAALLSWHGVEAPLVLVLLVSFGIGAAIGILACLGLVVRQRRALSAMQRELSTLGPERGITPR